jgi:hypothetical protein
MWPTTFVGNIMFIADAVCVRHFCEKQCCQFVNRSTLW